MDRVFFKNLLQTSLAYNIQKMVEESYKNYHVKGFNSIILSRSNTLTLRLYVCRPGEMQLNPENDNILVHNHSFDFQTQVLIGYMQNAVYEPSSIETDEGAWYQYLYESALKTPDKKMKLTFRGQRYLKLLKIETINAGESYFLKHNEFHRIFVPNNQLVAMLFWQYSKIEHPPIIFSKIPQAEEFKTVDLYNRFSDQDEIRDMVNLVIKNL